jgi:hypothetical protein
MMYNLVECLEGVQTFPVEACNTKPHCAMRRDPRTATICYVCGAWIRSVQWESNVQLLYFWRTKFLMMKIERHSLMENLAWAVCVSQGKLIWTVQVHEVARCILQAPEHNVPCTCRPSSWKAPRDVHRFFQQRCHDHNMDHRA